ncbi:MAG: cytochrome c oxidase subunit 3 [Alphaproteobacteria bacterium]|nr:MAG: cytochrome c oxidase subunit 3 [Alphaproteobacteria bacterium]
MAHDEVKHDYHLVDPSPWPLIGSISAFVLAIGAITWMRTDDGGFLGMSGYWLFVIGMLGVLYTMFEWWRDVIKEAERGDCTPVVQIGQRYGMVLFIASEVMFFVAWFWAYFNVSLFPGTTEAAGGILTGQVGRADMIGGSWPPVGVQTFDPWHLPFINTVILLTSGATVTWAHHALQHGDRRGTRNGLILTILLGLTFTCIQAYEYSHAAFQYAGNVYGATFFMATGFHGFHVIVGTIFLIVCLFRVLVGQMTPKQHFGFEAAAWYWHFVDVVWLFLFAVIYVIGQGPGVAH